jgi:hypothetical protein
VSNMNDDLMRKVKFTASFKPPVDGALYLGTFMAVYANTTERRPADVYLVPSIVHAGTLIVVDVDSILTGNHLMISVTKFMKKFSPEKPAGENSLLILLILIKRTGLYTTKEDAKLN